jgi:undecaprenyl-diphosphatase
MRSGRILPPGATGSRTLTDRSRSKGHHIVRRVSSSDHPSAGATPPAPAAIPLRSRVAERLTGPGRPRPLVVVGGFVAVFACLLVLGAIAEDIHEQEAIALDALVTPLFHRLASPILDALMRAFTDLGSTLVIAPLLVIALVLLVARGHRREALFLFVSMLGSLLLNQSLKLIFHRARPQLDWALVQPEYSFPSGHSMNSFVFYVALALIVWVLRGRRAGLLALVVALMVALLVGISRIYLGFHYFTDVVGGFLAGAVWLFVVAAAFDIVLRLRHGRVDAPGRPGG